MENQRLVVENEERKQKEQKLRATVQSLEAKILGINEKLAVNENDKSKVADSDYSLLQKELATMRLEMKKCKSKYLKEGVDMALKTAGTSLSLSLIHI